MIIEGMQVGSRLDAAEASLLGRGRFSGLDFAEGWPGPHATPRWIVPNSYSCHTPQIKVAPHVMALRMGAYADFAVMRS